MTILELIQAQCRALGVSEKYAEKIQKLFKIEKEEGIGAFVQMFKDNVLPDIQPGEQPNQAAIQTAVQTAIAEYEKKHNLKDGKPAEKQDPTTVDTSGFSPEVKAILENQNKQIESLTGLVTGMVKSQEGNKKLEQVKAKMKGKVDDEFLEEFAGRVNLEAENLDAEIETQVKGFTTLKQKFINKAVADGSYTPVAGGASDNDFNQYLNGDKGKSAGDDFGAIKI